MRLQVTGYLRVVFAIALVVGMVSSPNARLVSHDVNSLSQIVTDHYLDLEDHGHDHEDIVDMMHAYDGHGHDLTDHDHNVEFLQQRAFHSELVPIHTIWATAIKAMPDRKDFDLDRPPRA